MNKTLDRIPTARTMTRNIVRVFMTADETEIASGLEWYQRARDEAEHLVRSYGTGVGVSHETAVEKAAAVIAVLSPRLSWPKNVALARMAYGAHADIAAGIGSMDAVIDAWPGLKINAKKAFRILSGENPDDVVSGPKVRAFWHTIMDPSDPRAVVVDRHAFDVAVNKVLTDESRGKWLGLKGTYDLVSKAYNDAAREINKLGLAGREVTPAGVQAVTWDLWRRTRAAAYHGD